MPAVVAVAIRYIIMAGVQLGLWSLAEKYGIALLNKAIKETAELLGATEDEARDLVANHVLQGFESVGVFALTLRTKLPVKVAELLGFTSKGFVYKALSPKLAKFFTRGAVVTAGKVAATAPELEKVAESVAVSKGLNKLTVVLLWTAIFQAIGATSNIASTVGNWIDFANWQGTYKQNFVDLFAKFGFVAIAPLPKANTISQDAWKRIYSVVEELGPETIAFPWEDTTKPYSRQNLVDAVDHFAANLAAEGIAPTYTNVWKLLLPCIKVRAGAFNQTTQTTVAVTKAQTVTTPKVQVFTGVISQGVLGNGVTFQARTNDMIDDMAELVESASVNLANFLTALPTRVSYEIKIVSSVTSKDGFTQRGTTTQVITAYNANGTPRYKTITNKFAVLYLYLMTDKGTRTKLATINVGPVNSVNFQVTSTDLATVATHLQGVVTTSDISKITTITTPNNIGVQAPVVSAPAVIQPTIPIVTAVASPYVTTQTNQHYVIGIYGSKEVWTDQTMDNVKRAYPNGPWYELTKQEWDSYGTSNQSTSTATVTGLPVTTTQTTPPPVQTVATSPPAQRLGANANTLYEWYTANGKSLPTVAERAILYEQYGLGNRSLYVFNAEQNGRLLDKLKGF